MGPFLMMGAGMVAFFLLLGGGAAWAVIRAADLEAALAAEKLKVVTPPQPDQRKPSADEVRETGDAIKEALGIIDDKIEPALEKLKVTASWQERIKGYETNRSILENYRRSLDQDIKGFTQSARAVWAFHQKYDKRAPNIEKELPELELTPLSDAADHAIQVLELATRLTGEDHEVLLLVESSFRRLWGRLYGYDEWIKKSRADLANLRKSLTAP